MEDERGISESELIVEILELTKDILTTNDKLQYYVGMDSRSEDDQLRMGALSVELTIQGCSLGTLKGLYKKYIPERNLVCYEGILNVVEEGEILAKMLMTGE